MSRAPRPLPAGVTVPGPLAATAPAPPVVTGHLPQPPAITAAVGQVADEHARANEIDQAVVMANAITALYGLSGSGKSSLCDTAMEYCWETFKEITLCYTIDLGGFGTKRLALIRAGICIAWDPRNHQDPFATMEMASLGAFPAYLLPGGPATQEERDKGWAPPDCELLMPHRKRWEYVCPSLHDAGVYFYSPHEIVAAGVVKCRTCGADCAVGNPAVRLQERVVRTAGFGRVGLRVYDSMTALNDWGSGNLKELSAQGLLPTGAQGGSALGSADALVSGQFKFGTGSKAQVGFMQNSSHRWIGNIKTIPDQVVPAHVTFMVEYAGGSDETGGQPVLGPKIEGNARTAAVGGWVGNLLHVERDGTTGVHRMWLKNHVDPMDPRRVPYLAKTRGTPLGLPDFLEDEPNKPWSRCNMGVLFQLLAAQVPAEIDSIRQRFPDAPAFQAAVAEEEVVVRTPSAQTAPGLAVAGGVRALPMAGPAVQSVAPAPSVPARRVRTMAGPAPVAAIATAAPAAASTAAATPAPPPVAVAAPSPAVPSQMPPQPAPAAAPPPMAVQAPVTQAPAPVATAPAATPAAGAVRRPTRTPRPPV